MGKSVDASYRILAASYLRKQARQLARQLDGVRTAEDIESVHQARVASRRLRAAMRVFEGCFSAKRMRHWEKQIRRATSALGDARDHDVQIDFLYGALHTLDEPACLPGVARLLVHLEQQREELQPAVVGAVERLEASGVLRQMRRAAKRILAGRPPKSRPRPGRRALRIARRHVLARLDELTAFEGCLGDRQDVKRHHAMRIAAKRLRYTIEIVAPLYFGELAPVLAEVRQLQEKLGEVHDCDVWSERLAGFEKAQRRRIRKLYGDTGPFARLEMGINYLRRDRCQRRGEMFDELAACWERLGEREVWQRLVDIVQRARPSQPPPAPVERREPAASRAEGHGEPAREESCGGEAPGGVERPAQTFHLDGGGDDLRACNPGHLGVAVGRHDCK